MFPVPLPRPVLLAGAGLIGAVYLIGSNHAGTGSAAPECRFEVAADVLNVRSAPTESAERVGRLNNRQQVDGTPTVVAGFRQLRNGTWAATDFLTPMPGSGCNA